VKIEWDSNCDGTVDTTLFDQNIPAPYQYEFTLGQFYHPGSITKECLHKITWSAVDLLGNEEDEHVQLHKVDNTPPHVLILKPVDGWYSDGEDIPVAGIAEDRNSKFTCEHDCYGLGTDCAVGIEDGTPCYGYFLDVLPQLKMVQLESHMLYNASQHECQGWVTLNNTASELPDGIVIFVLGAQDNLGNMANSLDEIQQSVMATCGCDVYDLCAPSCIDDAINDIVLNWNLPKIGLDNYPLNIDIVDPEGNNLVIGGTDNPLHVEAEVNDGKDGQVTSGITTGTPCYITIAGVSVGTVPFMSDTDTCNGTFSVPVNIPQGQQELKVELADNAGNIEGMGMISVIVDTQGPAPVSISITGTEKDGIYDTDGSYEVHWTGGEDANFKRFVVYRDGILYATFDWGTNSFGESDMPDGPHVYSVEAEDLGGWKSSSPNATVIVDTKKPDITITGTSGFPSMWTLTYTVSDPAPSSGIDKVVVSDSDTTYVGCFPTPSGGWCMVVGGTYVELTAYDKAGNSDSDSTLGSAADTTPPMITTTSPSGVIDYNEVTLQATTSELAKCYFGAEDDLDSMALMSNNGEGYGTAHSAGLGVLADGLHVYHIQCMDTSGNWMEHSKTVVFSINTDSQYCYRNEMNIGEGWNTFFLPKMILDDINFSCSGPPYKVADVLETLEGQYSIVWYFDGAKWLFYDPADPDFSTLTEFSDQISSPYYIKMTSPGTLEFSCKDCPPPEPVCGNGLIEGQEQCDNGESNGIACVPVYGEFCDYCSNECTTVTVQGGFCGDGQVNGQEQCEPPDDNYNPFCTQTAQQCYGDTNKTQLRDPLGYCTQSCGCQETEWGSPHCVKDSCGAACGSDSDCSAGQTCNTEACQCMPMQS
jgi:hypothetical protein